MTPLFLWILLLKQNNELIKMYLLTNIEDRREQNWLDGQFIFKLHAQRQYEKKLFLSLQIIENLRLIHVSASNLLTT